MRETFAIAAGGMLPPPEMFAGLFVVLAVVWTIQWFIDLSGGSSADKSRPAKLSEEEELLLQEDLDEMEREDMGSRLRACPDCWEEVSKRATKCRHCGCPLVPFSESESQ